MNCTHHAGQVSFANCVVCGRPFCQDCLAQLAEGYTCSECRSRKENLWTGVILTFLGILLFLDNFIEGFIEQALRMWPIVLIGIGSVKILGHFRKEKV